MSIAASVFTDPREGRLAQLALIGDGEHLIELRARHAEKDWRKRWCRTPADADRVAASLTGRGVDLYVGMLPRLGRTGPQERQYAPSRVLWADCDTARSVHKLADFEPGPTLAWRSGGREGGIDKRHAVWLLEEPVPSHELRPHLLRLAHRLDADRASCDVARVLRVIGSRHHETGRVATAVAFTGEVHTLAAVTGDLPDPPGDSANHAGRGIHEPPPQPIHAGGGRHGYVKDIAIRLARAGLVDREDVAALLRCMFERHCEPEPAPAADYFENWAKWVDEDSEIAGCVRTRAEFAARWAGRRNGA